MKKRKKSGGGFSSWIRGLSALMDGPLDFGAAVVAGGLVWSLLLLSTGILHIVWGYGEGFLQMMAGLYPGYRPGSALGLFVLTLYGIVDGGLCAGLLALVYNKLSR